MREGWTDPVENICFSPGWLINLYPTDALPALFCWHLHRAHAPGPRQGLELGWPEEQLIGHGLLPAQSPLLPGLLLVSPGPTEEKGK